jgi:hypothetical protein
MSPILDSDRRPVRGLEASDFVVREDGRPGTSGLYPVKEYSYSVAPYGASQRHSGILESHWATRRE